MPCLHNHLKIKYTEIFLYTKIASYAITMILTLSSPLALGDHCKCLQSHETRKRKPKKREE